MLPYPTRIQLSISNFWNEYGCSRFRCIILWHLSTTYCSRDPHMGSTSTTSSFFRTTVVSQSMQNLSSLNESVQHTFAAAPFRPAPRCILKEWDGGEHIHENTRHFSHFSAQPNARHTCVENALQRSHTYRSFAAAEKAGFRCGGETAACICLCSMSW